MPKKTKKNRTASDRKNGASGGIKRILINTCCIFTVMIFIVHLIYTAVYDGSSFQTNIGFTAGIFALSFLASTATMTYGLKNLAFWQSHLIVYVAIGAVFYILTVLIPGQSGDFRRMLVAMSLYTIAFLIVTGVILIVKAVKNRKRDRKDENYSSKF